MKLSTCLIGEDSLLIQCGEILLNRGHDITLIISPIKKIQTWAKKHNIFLLENVNDFFKLHNSTKFDFIFSIVNSCILSEPILQLARYAAINYHDSPLPKYAGLNATSWAILNGEKNHGITWHLMANKIDQGDIVAQRLFPIYEHDTAFTLNLRCYEFAIGSFQKLIIDIENKKLSPKKQNLHERSYYVAESKLPNLGFINWQHFSAEQIDRMHRALTFGHYNNSLGTLKIYCSGSYLLIAKLEIAKLDLVDKTEPGIILLIETNAIYIATVTKPIKITGLLLTNGSNLTIGEFITTYSIKVGYKFESFNSTGLTTAQESYSSVIRHEKFWLKSLTELTEHTIFSCKGINTTQEVDVENYEINLKNIFPNKQIQSITHILITAILIYLYRLNNHENVSVFFIHPDFSKYHNTCANFFAYLLPFNFKLPINFTILQTLNFIEESILTIHNKGLYFTDIIARHPDFAEKSIEPNIVISFTNEFKVSLLPQKSMLYFQIDAKEGTIKVYHRYELSLQSMLKQIFANLSQHITNILINLINNPHLSTTHFSFLTEHERYQLLRNLGPGEKRFLPTTLPIVSIFKKQVLTRPENTAIVTNRRSMSYSELWDASEKVADFIRAKGITEQSLIGIYLDRSIEMMVAILGILKAKAAYVPLDTKYPLPRIEYILDEAKINLLLVQDKFLTKLDSHFNNGSSRINLFSIEDILKNSNAQYASSPPIKHEHCERLAYVMFTSGTTGTPKGVMVTQSNVINYCYWFLESTHFNDTSIIDFSSSIAFDLSVPCTIAPLLVGGCIAVGEEGEKVNPKQYLTHLKKHRITHVEITPGYLHLLLNYPEEIQQLNDLKWLLLGADTVSKTDVLKWLSLCPKHRVVNEYGPTETTVAVTSYFIDPEKLPIDSAVPIGRPAYNTQCYILDKYKNLCPIGMIGELYIGGAQISKGYLNKPTLTQDKFIISNINKTNEVLYKTGDVAYWLPDENLQFLGRNDHQVKIQGYRVEIAEIESTLKQIPGINQAIVIAQAGKFRNQYLRAYLLCDKLFSCDDEIKKALVNYLPNYMIPKEFCLIDFIPLKENEKIDYESLKKQQYHLLTSSSKKSSSKNSSFQKITLQIWQHVFNNTLITIHDNFFDLGGDSLIALQIIDEMQRHYSIDIPVRHLFEYPTVALLANKVYELCGLEHKPKLTANAIPTNNTIIQLSQGAYEIPIFLVHPVGGTIFWYKQLASLLQGKYTLYGIQDPNIDGKNVFFESLEDMAAYYVAEIKKIYSGDYYCLGGASFGATVAFAMAHQLTRMGKKIPFLGLFDGWAHYPEDIKPDNYADLLKNNAIDEQKLSTQRKETLLNLENHRQLLLKKYKLPFIKVDTALFKASELWPLFHGIEDINNGWRAYIGGQIRTYKVPGNHETMFFYPHVQTLAEAVNKHLILSTMTKLNKTVIA
ncbi:MAG: amino acid adenylation domain protein [Gammaproteobacteria bacterium]|nr:amino acid adenylation domain protein [Gammaproteobacteria bacterium]